MVRAFFAEDTHDDKWRDVPEAWDRGFSCVVDGDDVGMVEPGGGLGFANGSSASCSSHSKPKINPLDSTFG